jgi:flagellar basal-body rod protein FlgF
MDATSYVTLSHMTALRRQMDMIANNLANMSTSSYKAEKPLFTQFLNPTDQATDQPAGDDAIAYVEDFGVVRNLQTGTISPTGNPLDVAINGEGYYQIETAEGVRYSRAGIFSLSAQGEIVTRDGDRLLDDAGQPLQIPQGTRTITISTDGTVSADNLPVGRIVPVAFENERALKKLPGGLYETDQQPTPLETFDLRQGMVEGSNVQPVLEMTNMIEVSRAYQTAQKFVEQEHQRVKTAIGKLAGNG